jgi:hypothetical protein
MYSSGQDFSNSNEEDGFKLEYHWKNIELVDSMHCLM